jgi:hypothetical protein
MLNFSMISDDVYDEKSLEKIFACIRCHVEEKKKSGTVKYQLLCTRMQRRDLVKTVQPLDWRWSTNPRPKIGTGDDPRPLTIQKFRQRAAFMIIVVFRRIAEKWCARRFEPKPLVRSHDVYPIELERISNESIQIGCFFFSSSLHIENSSIFIPTRLNIRASD